MSYTFTFTERNSVLSTNIYPPIILEENVEYVLGLINLDTYYSIPNVDESNNKFCYAYQTEKDKLIIEIPEGSYEIRDTHKYLKYAINDGEKEEEKVFLDISANTNTMRTEIKCNRVIFFDQPNSIGSLLGFTKRKLDENNKHVSDYTIDIQNSSQFLSFLLSSLSLCKLVRFQTEILLVHDVVLGF